MCGGNQFIFTQNHANIKMVLHIHSRTPRTHFECCAALLAGNGFTEKINYRMIIVVNAFAQIVCGCGCRWYARYAWYDRFTRIAGSQHAGAPLEWPIEKIDNGYRRNVGVRFTANCYLIPDTCSHRSSKAFLIRSIAVELNALRRLQIGAQSGIGRRLGFLCRFHHGLKFLHCQNTRSRWRRSSWHGNLCNLWRLLETVRVLICNRAPCVGIIFLLLWLVFIVIVVVIRKNCRIFCVARRQLLANWIDVTGTACRYL